MSERQGMKEGQGCDARSQLQKYPPGTLSIKLIMERAWELIKVAHLYPFSLNSNELPPTFFSETTPRGHDPRTACRIAGVMCKGGAITRIKVVDANDRANGIRFVLNLSFERLAELSRRGEAGRGVPAREPGGEGEGFENAIARRSSLSLP